MKENEILSEIHRVREEIARECDYDVHKLFASMRRRTEKFKAEGGRVASPTPRETEQA
jgi:hypothetical protein